MRALVMGLVIAMAIANAASADDAADREEAGRAFVAGQAADRQRDYYLAIQHYLRANDLVPHPNTMFNIATDYEKLNKLREAAVWYQRYVEAAPDAPDRDKIMRLIRDLATRSTTLTVRTIPPGARVLVDGDYVGTSPMTGKIKGGQHRITFEHDGQKENKDINVEFGEPAVLDLTLRGESGTLRVVGTPPGAVVTVDDMPAGAMPATLELEPGSHAIHVTAYGYSPFDTTATIIARQTTTVPANLRRDLGTLDGGARTIRTGYLLGFGGGAELRGEGAMVLVDLGVRVSNYDGAIRIGKMGDLKVVDFVGRAGLGKARLQPYVGGGYAIAISSADDSGTSSSTSSSGTGYCLIGGLRFTIGKNDHTSLDFIVESGLRFHPGLSSSDSSAQTTFVPLMSSLQVVYR